MGGETVGRGAGEGNGWIIKKIHLKLSYYMTNLYPSLTHTQSTTRILPHPCSPLQYSQYLTIRTRPRCSSTDEEEENMVHMHTGILCSHKDKCNHGICGNGRDCKSMS